MSLSQNQFKEIVVQGMLTQQVDLATLSCQVDSTQASALIPGQGVTIVDSAGGVPKIISVAADTNDIFGFVNYTTKDKSYAAGHAVEISFFRGNVMWMTASAAIARGAKVMVVVSGTKVATRASTGVCIGRALDKAAADGDLIRVLIDLPGVAS